MFSILIFIILEVASILGRTNRVEVLNRKIFNCFRGRLSPPVTLKEAEPAGRPISGLFILIYWYSKLCLKLVHQ